MNPLRTMARRLFQCLNRAIAVRENVTIGRNVHIGPGSVLWAPPGHTLVLEDDVYIGKHCTIEVPGRIGSHAMIANSVGLVGRIDHDFRTIGVPMRRAPWVGESRETAARLASPIEISPDAWVGYGAVVLSGVTVGRGAIVAAGSVVTGDVSPYTIVAGIPAREVGRRFGPEDAHRHESVLAREYGLPMTFPLGE